MKYINRSIVGESGFHLFECFKQERIKLFIVIKFIVSDFSRRSLVIDSVGGVCNDEICLISLHKRNVGFGQSAIPANEAVPAQRPYIASL
jgi:hypothetical protein